MKSQKNNKIELMAPVGSLSALHTAINAGADAVYFGISDFSMRTGKKNFKIGDLPKIKNICQKAKRKPKMYLTLNTIIYNKELKKLEKILDKAKRFIDAAIVSDFAAINICKKYRVPFIVSTQCSISNTESAKFYKKLGAKRVVLARELSLKQIKEIARIKSLEFEVFAHGAMCVAVSGRCFLSQFLFNKSANRGNCLHPCRRKYSVKEKELGYELTLENSTIISAKDLCTLPFIEKIKKTGVSALKIEGRNRDERYIKETVTAYRKALDQKLSTQELINLMKNLESVFNRGFSSGFYLGDPTPHDFAEIENSASKTYRDYIGNVSHFYPKISVALVNIKKNMKIGDRLAFIDDFSGLNEIDVKEIEVDHKRRNMGKKGEEVAIKTNFKVKKGAEVYIIKKR